MADNLNFDVVGSYIGYNKKNGIGPYNARIFIRREDGSVVDGLVPINIFHGLVKENNYNLHLIKGNDPYKNGRDWI